MSKSSSLLVALCLKIQLSTTSLNPLIFDDRTTVLREEILSLPKRMLRKGNKRRLALKRSRLTLVSQYSIFLLRLRLTIKAVKDAIAAGRLIPK